MDKPFYGLVGYFPDGFLVMLFVFILIPVLLNAMLDYNKGLKRMAARVIYESRLKR